MPDDTTQTLSHEDALEALKEARRQAAEYRTKHTSQKSRADHLSAALSAAGLDPEADDLDTHAAALKDAGKGQEQLEALRIEADVYAAALEAAGVDPEALMARLDKLPESASDDDVSKAIAEHVKPITDTVGKVQKLERQANLDKAATALGKPADALAEIVGDKLLSFRTVKGEDGKDVEQWVIGEGDSAKPLAEMKSIQLLGTAQPDKPAPAPLPTGQRGGSAPAAKTVEQRTAEVKREISI